MNREIHVRFWESAGVRFPCATQPITHSSNLSVNTYPWDGKGGRTFNEVCGAMGVSLNTHCSNAISRLLLE